MAVEKCRCGNHADERDRKAYLARMIQNLAAIIQRAIDPGNRKQPQLRQNIPVAYRQRRRSEHRTNLQISANLQ
jgi:hypothetical protein